MRHNLYQPALLPRHIKSLYYLKLETGRPMTWHARMAVDLYLSRFPSLRHDETAIQQQPGPLRDRGEFERMLFGDWA